MDSVPAVDLDYALVYLPAISSEQSIKDTFVPLSWKKNLTAFVDRWK